jgi:cobaltochelatase CobT
MHSNISVLREAIGTVTQALAHRGIKVRQQGVKAKTITDKNGKPVEIVIPSISDDATEDFIQAVHGFIDSECSGALFTDFKQIRSIESDRNVHMVAKLIEQVRAENEMCREYRGSKENLTRVGKLYSQLLDEELSNPEEDATKAMIRASMGDTSASAVLGMPEHMVASKLLPAIMRNNFRSEAFEDLINKHKDKMPNLYEPLSKFGADIGKLTSTADSIDLARQVIEAFRDAMKEPPESAGGKSAKDDEINFNDKPAKSKGKSDGKSSGSKSKSEKPSEDTAPASDDEEEETPSSGSEEDEEDTPEEESGSGEEEEGGEEGDSSDEEGDDDEGEDDSTAGDDGESESKGTTDDEEVDSSKARAGFATLDDDEIPDLKIKDVSETVSDEFTKEAIEAAKKSDYFVLTTDYDIVKPMKDMSAFHGVDMTEVDRFDAECSSKTGTLQKGLEMAFMSKSMVRVERGLRSGRLDGSNLHRLASGDTRVFARKQMAVGRNVVVSLLVDCSGSMARGNKIGVAAQSAYALSSVLSRINISHEVLGFTTKGVLPGDLMREYELLTGKSVDRREPLLTCIAKNFRDRFTPDVKRSILAFRRLELANNVDGESVEIAAKRLMREKADRHILIVLSDGEPCASGYGDFQWHLKKVVKDYSKMIDIVGIGIQDSSVRHYYKNHLVVNNLDELPGVVLGQLRGLLMKGL